MALLYWSKLYEWKDNIIVLCGNEVCNGKSFGELKTAVSRRYMSFIQKRKLKCLIVYQLGGTIKLWSDQETHENEEFRYRQVDFDFPPSSYIST